MQLCVCRFASDITHPRLLMLLLLLLLLLRLCAP